MSRLSLLRQLRAGDYPRLLVAALLLVGIRISVFLVSFSRLRESLLTFTAAISVPGSPVPAHITWSVIAADRWLPGHRTCLMRSLSAEVLLTLYGHRPDHRIGVDPGEDGLKAHSWLEYDEEILIGDLEEDLSRYTPLPTLESVEW